MKTLLIITALAAVPVAASANLVVNGSFEANQLPGGSWGVISSLTGWTGDPNIELRNNVDGTAEDGKQFVELDTFGNSAMYQQITGAPGKYTLSFWYSPRLGVGPGSNGLRVWFDGKHVTNLLTGDSGVGLNDNDWRLFSEDVDFDGSGQLRFAALGQSDGVGGSLDNVSLTPSLLPVAGDVPEPATLALTGAALVAVALARRRRA
ncbi:MAG TPA: PEP-CTERM sorting domain-containing protein [Burkholderiaceae bacterium]|nr:PEP-CTERM sorting domain-containing protein [Burkholderiaceae bacterium]